jgi:hypothetical protein
MKTASLLLFATLVMVGCGDGRSLLPVAPSPAPASPTPAPAFRGFTLSGLVTGVTPGGSLPLPGAVIRIETTSGVFAATTDAAGYYTISGLPIVDCSITVHKEGYEGVLRSVYVTEDSVINFELPALR